MAQLPPKIPNMQQHNWSSHRHESIMPSLPPTSSFAPANTITTNPSWVDEFLDFSAARRGSHRKSMSDSVTFLEMPMPMPMPMQMPLEECRGNNAAAAVPPGPVPNNNNNNNNNNHRGHHSQFDKFDDEHFISMLTREFSGAGVGVLPTISSSNPSSPSDHNSINDDDKESTQQPGWKQRYLNEEVQSQCNSTPNAATTTSGGSRDRIVDPKRVKRILANRQSAQRSRVRKLQYISELERSVASLQAEVSVLSPRVAFLDHQRLLLNVDNSALKQRIAALAQDKIFKDETVQIETRPEICKKSRTIQIPTGENSKKKQDERVHLHALHTLLNT